MITQFNHEKKETWGGGDTNETITTGCVLACGRDFNQTAMELPSLSSSAASSPPAATATPRAAKMWSRTRAAMPSRPACSRASSASRGVPRTGSHSNSHRSSHPAVASPAPGTTRNVAKKTPKPMLLSFIS
uniref:Uncharacterized protein n=1 Tax=Arundo donax TaxID=35708 RepID=A0A0A9FDA7_ARUDO